MAVTDAEMADAVQLLACRSMSGHSEELPLRIPGSGDDASMGGRFWVQFRDANAAQRDALEGAFTKDMVKRGGDVVRQYGTVDAMDILVEQGLIRAAVLPALDPKDPAGKTVLNLAWPKGTQDQKQMIRPRANTEDQGITWPLMQVLVSMAMDFYLGVDMAVEELGNSSTTLESSPSEETEAVASSSL